MNSFVAVQNFYTAALQKIAQDESCITPDYSKDSRAISLDQLEDNKHDQRKELENLLAAARQETNSDTKVLDKALPKAMEKKDTTTSNPLVKIAMNMAFFEAIRRTPFIKTSSADFLKKIYTSFNDELTKIE